MQKVEGDALHMDNIHTQKERTRKPHMRPTLKEAKQRQMGNIHMQRDFKQRRNIRARTRRDTRHRRFQTTPTRRDITQHPATTLQLEAIAHTRREMELLHPVSTPILKDSIQLLQEQMPTLKDS